MTDDELERLLTEWGALSKYEAEKREGASDFHVLQRARDFAPGTRERAIKRIIGRGGTERRTMMARDLAACGVRIVPMSFVDPIRGKDSRNIGPRERAGESMPDHLRRINNAALELYRCDTLRGLVLRQEYCGYGPQAIKAERVSLALAHPKPMGLRVYREALAGARGWMLGHLTR